MHICLHVYTAVLDDAIAMRLFIIYSVPHSLMLPDRLHPADPRTIEISKIAYTDH